MDVSVGTSGFSYPAWKGRFYPQKLPNGKMLGFYSTRFKSVELNNTFYRMPTESNLVAWRDEVPDEFRFAIKAPRRITHIERLAGAGDALTFFLNVLDALGKKRGPILFQLPPFMKKDLERLRAFLAQLKSVRAAFEFRHPSWFDAEVFGALESVGA